MRGVAVLAVVLCHAFPKWFPYGWLGVDLFFVISGYLMTKMIVSDRFTFRSFYLRRARRLLPACLSTLAVSTGVALIVLRGPQWQSFYIELVGALTFTANLTALIQTADFYPLRHIWSLSLEEQFYFVYPLLLWLVPARHRLPCLAGLAAISFAGWALLADRELAFFILPFRAWELLAGGLIYLAGFTKPTPLRFKPLEVVGDWSYSLYLIHWPLFAFVSVFVGWPLTPAIAAAVCLFSVALAALQYQFVEQRFKSPDNAHVAPVIVVSAPRADSGLEVRG